MWQCIEVRRCNTADALVREEVLYVKSKQYVVSFTLLLGPSQSSQEVQRHAAERLQTCVKFNKVEFCLNQWFLS